MPASALFPPPAPSRREEEENEELCVPLAVVAQPVPCTAHALCEEPVECEQPGSAKSPPEVSSAKSDAVKEPPSKIASEVMSESSSSTEAAVKVADEPACVKSSSSPPSQTKASSKALFEFDAGSPKSCAQSCAVPATPGVAPHETPNWERILARTGGCGIVDFF